MRVSVLVPFGADDSPAGKQRAKVWRYNARRWDRLRVTGLVDEVIVGIDRLFVPYCEKREIHNCIEPRQFSVSRALNDAAKHAHGDVFLLFGADHVPDPAVIGWALGSLRHHPWVRLHDHVLYATEAATHLIVDGPFGDNLFQDTANWKRHSAPCPGVLALTRAAWDTAGGMNEQFQGHGFEDTEFLSRLHHHVPRGSMGPSGLPLRELWHPSHRVYDESNPNLAVFAKITQERGW